jgi:negative regulator of flagellin synthesis FlgM
LSAQPAIDQAKVAQISKALANGTYTISADKIASGLMQSEQTLAQIGIE